MSNSAPLDFRTIDLKNLVVPPLLKKDHGLSTKPLYSTPESSTPGELAVQTPICRFPFGLSNNSEQPSYVQGTPVRYNVSASFKDYQTNPLMKEFYNFCSQIQEYGVHLAAHNSEAWFGDEADAKACRMLFNKWIKVSKGENADKYDPTFRLSVRAKKNKDGTEKEGEFWTTCYDIDGKEMDLRNLEKGSEGHMKIKLSSFYVIAGKFGFTWDVEWIRLTKRAQPRADDYNANMYGEAPSIPDMPTGEACPSILPLGDAPPSVTTAEESNDAGKREVVEAPSTGGGKRIKRTT